MGLRLPCLGNPGTKVQRCKQLEESFCARLVPHRHLAATEVEVEPTNRRAFECHADEALLRRAIHLWHIQNGFFQGVTRGSGYCAYWKPCSGDRHKPTLLRGPEIGRLATTGQSIGIFLSLGLACQHRRDGRWSEPGVHQGRHPASRPRSAWQPSRCSRWVSCWDAFSDPFAGKGAEIAGGLVLIGIGSVILYEHLSAA